MKPNMESVKTIVDFDVDGKENEIEKEINP